MLNSQRLSDQKKKNKEIEFKNQKACLFWSKLNRLVVGAKEYDDVFSKVSGVLGEKSLRVVEFEVRTNEKET